MIENSSHERIKQIIAAQRAYFSSHATRSIDRRMEHLKRLRDGIVRHEKRLCDALYVDLHKSYEEAYMTEIGILLAEIDNFLKHLRGWAAPSKKRTPLKLFPSRSAVITEPLGLSLIIAPWNYPIQLLLNPLIGALAAGCTAILKPSPYTPNVAEALEHLIRDLFSEEHVAIVQGHREVNNALLSERYDIIFFTGSPMLGRVVMQAAAENLTPVVLELGGKSPVIVDHSADISLAAQRIAWGKTLNAGQTCIAPDYLLIHRDVKELFIKKFADAILRLHGDNIQQSQHYVRLVSDRAFDRVSGYLTEGRIRYGGANDRSERYIEPTLIDDVSEDSNVMNEEIFGPILPMIEIDNIDEAVTYINRHEKPLALYVFADEETARGVIDHTSSGGACINDTIMHIVNGNMPFGGVGNSGMGRYHGRDSLYAFSHRRAVLTTPTYIDLPFRYMPYRCFRWIKHLM